MTKAYLLLNFLLFSGLNIFAQQTEIDSLKKEVENLTIRVHNLEKFQGPAYSMEYFDDVDKAFLAVGYYQGFNTLSDSTGNSPSYGFNIQYTEDKISAVLNASWGSERFFSSFYLGYNFYSLNNRLAITPLIGATSWGNNIWDFQEAFWSFGISFTGMDKVPLSVSYFKYNKGMGLSLAYKIKL